MIDLSNGILSELEKRNKFIIPVVEIYPRDTIDIASNAAPADAIGRFANICYTWINSTGSYTYDAKILDFPEVSTYLSEQINTAEVTFSNVKRGKGSMSKFILDNNVKGCWMVIRLLFPDNPEESHVAFWGKCNRPGEISNESLTISASQDLGNYKQEIPFRVYQINCPLDFARPLGGCLGNQSLAEKSVAFRQAVADFGTAGCNKLFGTCTLLGNTPFFQGQRVVAVSGQFSYITVEEVVKRVLFWTKRKKIQVVKTDNWSSVNQSEDNEVIPLGFGRFQLQGHPFSWADVGEQVKSLLGFCEGKISAFTFTKSRTQGINILSVVEHLGDWGGVGTQGIDSLFQGVSGYNSRLAYLEVITDGSSPTQVDNAPIITSVIRGLEIPVPDPDGVYSSDDWSNNPVHITRFVLTDTRFARMPVARIDDEYNLTTAADCDEIVEDRTNEEAIVLPSNEVDNYGDGYRRFRSAGRYTAFKDMYMRDALTADQLDATPYPEFEEQEVRWFNPIQTYVLPPRHSVLKQKYTCNGALQEKTSILDFLNKRIFPTFKGFINYGSNGKIQIKNRRKADNGYLRSDVKEGATQVPVQNILRWRQSLHGYLLIGVSLETAEIRELKHFQYSTACNDLPVAGVATGAMSVSTSNLVGGTSSAPAIGYIDISGNPNAYDTVEITIDDGADAFKICYVADGIEDTETFTRMLAAFMQANIKFTESLSAYILPNNPTRIWIRCEAGYLNFDKPLEFKHAIGEEVLRVEAVFENCGELTANQSAQFDNIIADTFKWNSNEQDDVNAVVAKYTSAVDDFHITNLMPRAAWDTIDLEGELVKEELDLTFVDNYWQAAYLTKSRAIERIDGNLSFAFQSGMLAIRLELGDVVAIRHDSGDGALNYTPAYVTQASLDLNNFQTKLGFMLYLSAAFDYHVQPIEPLLTTTLNAALYPDSPPPTIGTGGGQGVIFGTDPVATQSVAGYYGQFAGLGRYAPDGKDRV